MATKPRIASSMACPDSHLADGRRIDTRQGTIPKQSQFACGACGNPGHTRIGRSYATGGTLPVYAVQGYCPSCEAEGTIYGGRFFADSVVEDAERLDCRENTNGHARRDTDLRDYWPREEIPHAYMTHHANFALPEQGYTHW